VSPGNRGVGCGWAGVGEVDGVVDQVFSGFVGIDEFGFFLGHGQGEEHDLAQIGEGGGGALGDAVLGQGGEDFVHDVVDVGGGQEIAGEGGGHFRAQAVGFEELVLGVGVEEAEGRVVAVTEHAALAIAANWQNSGLLERGSVIWGSPLEEGFSPQRAQRTQRRKGGVMISRRNEGRDRGEVYWRRGRTWEYYLPIPGPPLQEQC
jgi:hypothetical protein